MPKRQHHPSPARPPALPAIRATSASTTSTSLPHRRQPVLTDVCLDIPPARYRRRRPPLGKSTCQADPAPLRAETGRVFIDGATCPGRPAWLSGRSGVLQENILFNRTVRENIASPNRYGHGAVIEAAQLAAPTSSSSPCRRAIRRHRRARGEPFRRPAPARRHRPGLVVNPRILISTRHVGPRL